MRNQTKKKLKVVGWIGAVIGGLVVLMVLGNSGAYERELEAATREGAIVEPEALRQKYAVAPGTNSADVIRHSLSLHPKRISFQHFKSWTVTSKGIDPTLLRDCQTMVATLGNLDTYLSLTGCDFAYPYAQGAALRTPEMSHMRNLCAAMRILADDALARRDYDSARTDLRVAYKLCDEVVRTPLLWATFTGMRIARDTDRDLVTMAARHIGDHRAYALFRELLSQPRKVDYVRGVEGELCLQHQVVNHLEELVRDPAAHMDGPAYWSYVPSVVRQWRIHHLHHLRWTHAMLTQYPTDWRQCAEISEQHYQEVEARDQRMPGNALDSILETSFNRFFLEVMAPETSRHIALAWLDILERGTKDMPTALPVPRQDAFNAKPLVLHVRKEDVAICSAGLNGKDESGEVRQGDDVEIALPREFFNTALGDTIKP